MGVIAGSLGIILAFIVVIAVFAGTWYFMSLPEPTRRPRIQPRPANTRPSKNTPTVQDGITYTRDELELWVRYLKEKDSLTTGQRVKAEQLLRTLNAAANAEQHTRNFTSKQKEQARELATNNRRAAATRLTQLLDQAQHDRESTYVKGLRVDNAYLNDNN